MPTSSLRPFWVLPPLLLGLALVLLLPRFSRPPQPLEQAERAVKVRVIEATPAPLVPRALGYGRSQPLDRWDGVAEVAGTLVWLADELRAGELVAKGRPLLRIDQAPYRLALAQAKAQLQALRVKLVTTERLIALEQQGQALLRRELERKRQLNRDGSLSTTQLEEAERAWLKGEVVVQGLSNSQELTRAEITVAETQQAAAELDLARTELRAPFDLRLAEVLVGPSQYVSKGQRLLRGDGIEVAEVEARFPVGALRPLLRQSQASSGEQPPTPLRRTPGAMRLQARVRLHSATHSVEWPAQVTRVAGEVDPQTQTIGVVVRIDKPYAQARVGERPPLMRGTFVEVELSRPSQGRPILLPQSALRKGQVYLLDADNRLLMRPIKPALTQGSVIAVRHGLEPGERVVVSPLMPAVEGMLLDPEDDPKLLQRIQQEAGGAATRQGAGQSQGGRQGKDGGA
ncbi:MAG: efflux RND transporter periplasmic adaptor subunit [Gammaproteobacteria bacterium SHHR-1]|uniref:efflux RND transporter periplasmic adaptor subunit n=1 Tax=Magnetovirga frankeli TaxID=947516 RepID=UPI00129361C8|nr:efflux RND transporter periplasmic adaptor subunit [gamma proteobacterium SS-5]